jgi:hypothetical protein
MQKTITAMETALKKDIMNYEHMTTNESK